MSKLIPIELFTFLLAIAIVIGITSLTYVISESEPVITEMHSARGARYVSIETGTVAGQVC